MIFNESNGYCIDTDVHIHDSVLQHMEFVTKDKCLHLIMSKNNQVFHLFFDRVMGFEMTNCCFWGTKFDGWILGVEYVEPKERTLLPKLFAEQKRYDTTEFLTPLGELRTEQSYLEIALAFSSGDHLAVVSESMRFCD